MVPRFAHGGSRWASSCRWIQLGLWHKIAPPCPTACPSPLPSLPGAPLASQDPPDSSPTNTPALPHKSHKGVGYSGAWHRKAPAIFPRGLYFLGTSRGCQPEKQVPSRDFVGGSVRLQGSLVGRGLGREPYPHRPSCWGPPLHCGGLWGAAAEGQALSPWAGGRAKGPGGGWPPGSCPCAGATAPCQHRRSGGNNSSFTYRSGGQRSDTGLQAIIKAP